LAVLRSAAIFKPVGSFLGLEADFSWAAIDGDHTKEFSLSQSPGTLTVIRVGAHTKIDRLGTITGRIGYSWDRALLYVKGGAAWVRDQYHLSIDGTFFNGGAVDLTFASIGSANDNRWGWTIGTGFEYGLTQNWSVKAEYNYLDFGTDRIGFTGRCTVNCGAPPFERAFELDIRQHIHLVKVGINYRFGATAPGVASY
jgi:outer membrane immunogenic protein